MTLTKREVQARRAAWSRALEQIGRELGPESPITRGLGSLAWGRYTGEPAAADGLVNSAEGLGFLQGVRYALLQVAAAQGWEGEDLLRRIHRRGGLS